MIDLSESHALEARRVKALQDRLMSAWARCNAHRVTAPSSERADDWSEACYRLALAFTKATHQAPAYTRECAKKGSLAREKPWTS